MVLTVSIILLVIGIVFVAYPLFRSVKVRDKENEIGRESESHIKLILEELELDYEMGQISEEEYRELDAKYRAELN